MSRRQFVPFGEQVRRKRMAKGLTLRALARAVGVSAPFLSDVEHCRRNVSGPVLAKLEKILGRGLSRAIMTREDRAKLQADEELLDLVKRALADRPTRNLILRAGGAP